MPLQFVLGQKDNLLKYENFLHYRYRVNENSVVYKCVLLKKKYFPGVV